jgi:transcriptional regulator with XRE-family HTH domain
MPIKRGEMGGPAEQAFGRLVRRLRKERGLSQEGLAEKSGCDRSYLSFLERGINSPSLSMVFQLAGALGMKPSVLLAAVENDLDGGPTEGGGTGADPSPHPGT